MSDVFPDNCGWGATSEPAHCRGATFKSGFLKIQVSSCAKHPSDAVKLPGTTVCLPPDHVIQIHDGQSKNTTNITLLFDQLICAIFGWGDLSPSTEMIAFRFKNHTHKIFTKFAAKFHTHTLFFKLFHRHFVTNLPNSLCTCSVQQSSSTTNANSETGQMAVCCQNLMLGAHGSHSVLSVLVGMLLKIFGLFLNMPCMWHPPLPTHIAQHSVAVSTLTLSSWYQIYITAQITCLMC